MFNVFNMGLGLVIIADPTDEARLIDAFPNAYRVGSITAAAAGPSAESSVEISPLLS